jgi:hypothetical protein
LEKRTWWFEMSTILSGKSHSIIPSLFFLICPLTLSSPLTRIVTGAHQYVMVVTTMLKCCLVMAIHA